jgi:hypothetical protein
VEVNGLTVIQNGRQYPIIRKQQTLQKTVGRKELALMEENSPVQAPYSRRLQQPATLALPPHRCDCAVRGDAPALYICYIPETNFIVGYTA